METNDTEQMLNKIAGKLSKKIFNRDERIILAQEIMVLAEIIVEMYETKQVTK